MSTDPEWFNRYEDYTTAHAGDEGITLQKLDVDAINYAELYMEELQEQADIIRKAKRGG